MQKWIAIILLIVSTNAFSDTVNVQIPDAVKAVWVGENIVQNGVPMQVQSFTTGLSPDEMMSFYKSQWATPIEEGKPGYIENTVGDWLIISRFENNQNQVVQIKTGVNGGSEGFISVANHSAVTSKSKLMNSFPKMGGTEEISVTESNDFNKQATTLILQNSFSVASNVDYYKSNMRAKGWSINKSMVENNVATLLLSKKNYQCDISFSKSQSGKTIVFANIVSLG